MCTCDQGSLPTCTLVATPWLHHRQAASSVPPPFALSQLPSFPLSCCGAVYHPLRLPQTTPRCFPGHPNDFPRCRLWLLFVLDFKAFFFIDCFSPLPLLSFLPMPISLTPPWASLFIWNYVYKVRKIFIFAFSTRRTYSV